MQSIQRNVFLAAVAICGLAACSDPVDPGNVSSDPCAGACPADECFAGTCLGGNNGGDAGNNGADVTPDAPLDGCAPGECPDGQYCDVRDGEPRGECADGCEGDDDCNGVLVCREHQCIPGCDTDGACPPSDFCGPDGTCEEGCREGGCDDGFSCIDADGGRACLPTACTVRSDCPEGFACADGACAPGCDEDSCDDGFVCDPETLLCAQGCVSDDECEDTAYCDLVGGVCVDGCRDDAGCEMGFACVEHACAPGPCAANEDCADEYFCDGGTCAEGCREDAECPVGRVCAEGDCITGCRDRGVCADDQFCDLDTDLGFGQCRPGCDADAGCDRGDVCEENACVRGCRDDAGCPADSYCGAGTPGQCEVGCRLEGCEEGEACNPQTRVCDATCDGDDACPPGRVCRDSECTLGCDDNDARCGPGQICDGDADRCTPGCREDAGCRPGFICEALACVQGCRNDTQCGDGQVCDADACVDGCRQDADCGMEEVCVGIVCAPGCGNDDDCTDGRICQDEGCVDGCRADMDCGADAICEDLLCQAGCRADTDCGADAICEDLLCQAGCRADTDCGADAICEDLQCQAGCRQDVDCGADTICEDLACVVGCRENGDCGEGEICRDLTCTVGCQVDDDCSGPDICVDNACVTVRCVRDTDCGDDGYCAQGGACEPGCRDDMGCPQGQLCDPEHACRIGCRADEACAPTEYCDIGNLECIPGCRSGGCPGQQVCDPDTRACTNPRCQRSEQCAGDRFCDVDSGTCELGCRSDAGCADDEICGADNACVEGCRADLDCGDGQFCDGAPGGVCQSGCVPFGCPNEQVCDVGTRTCVDAPVPDCDEDGDCGQGQVCDFETLVCRPGCAADDDCGAGEICPAVVEDFARLCRAGCRADAACPAHQYCDVGFGVSRCVDGCREDSGCGPNEACEVVVEGQDRYQRCAPITCGRDTDCDDAAYCDPDADVCRTGCRVDGCPGNDLCDPDSRLCVEGPCQADGDCNSDDEICDGGQCRAGCRGDDACALGEICDPESNLCADGCREDAGCPELAFCSIEYREPAGRCEVGCRIGGCGVNEACDPEERACLFSECTVNTDCDDGEYCRAQVECLPGCGDDGNCGVGQVCPEETHACVVGCRDAEDGDDTCDVANPVDLELGDFVERTGELCLRDVDNYAIDLDVGEVLDFGVNAGNPDARLRVRVLQACGRVVLDLTEGFGDGEGAGVVALEGGTYVVEVSGQGPAETVPYTLSLFRNYPACVVDTLQGDQGPERIEPNEEPGSATPLQTEAEVFLSVPGLHVCDGDEDWYAVEVTAAGQRIAVTLSQRIEEVPLRVEIRTGDGRVLLASTQDIATTKTVATGGLNETGIYLIRVIATEDVGVGTGVAHALRLIVTGAACVPDAFEPNGNPESASLVARGEHPGSVCGADNDVDWYRFLLFEGETVNPRLRYSHDNGQQLNAVLYGPGGEQDLRDALFQVGDSDVDGLLGAPDGVVVGRGEAGEWYLSVSGGNGALPYIVDLGVDSPQCEQEEFPNQDCDSATPLGLGDSAQGLVCGPAGDEDWFSVSLEPGEELDVRLEHFHFDGNLELEVYAPGGETLLGFSYNAGPDLEAVSLTANQRGQHCIRVFVRSAQIQNRYTIALQ